VDEGSADLVPAAGALAVDVGPHGVDGDRLTDRELGAVLRVRRARRRLSAGLVLAEQGRRAGLPGRRRRESEGAGGLAVDGAVAGRWRREGEGGGARAVDGAVASSGGREAEGAGRGPLDDGAAGCEVAGGEVVPPVLTGRVDADLEALVVGRV